MQTNKTDALYLTLKKMGTSFFAFCIVKFLNQDFPNRKSELYSLWKESYSSHPSQPTKKILTSAEFLKTSAKAFFFFCNCDTNKSETELTANVLGNKREEDQNTQKVKKNTLDYTAVNSLAVNLLTYLDVLSVLL